MSRNSRVFPAVRDRARELRHPQTAAEATLWRALRARSLGYKFRRQHPIDRFIVDFYCAHARLCIEIDGGSHFEPEQQAHDAARTEYLEGQGYQVLRFTNDEVRYNPDAVASAIIRTIEKRLTPSP